MSALQEVPKEIYNFYLQTASNIITHCDDNEQKQMLKKLTEMVKMSCSLDTKLKESCEILERLSAPQNDCNENQEKIEHEKILKQFNDDLAQINTNVSKHKKFLDFKQQVKVFLDDAKSKNNSDKGDDELVMTQKEINVIDPITRKRIIDPVRNTACGHVYDRESVTALLKGNKKTKCPVAGCGNDKYIQLDNLQMDILTKRYLDQNPDTA